MTRDAIRVIGVIGTGTMGRGIIQLFAQAGYAVKAFDVVEGAAQKSLDYVNSMMARGVEKGRFSLASSDAVAERMKPCERLEDLADCDAILEAVSEDLEVKRRLFSQLEQVVGPQALLATNTSSLTVSEIAAGCAHPERVGGLHFFNPVPLMKVVEVVAAVRTSTSTVDSLKRLVQSTGHRAVVAADQPGFLVNHAGRGLYTEGLQILEEQVASHVDIDQLMRDAAGFRMGPFELMDLTGLDVSGKVMESIYNQFHQEPRVRPSSLVRPRIAAGLYGRKTGAGWYSYACDKRIEESKAPIPPLPARLQVWVDPASCKAEALSALVKSVGADLASSPEGDALLVVQPWGQDATSYCITQGLDASRCVALDPLTGLDRRRTLMLTVCTSPSFRDTALALFGAQGVPVTLINDSPGFVVQRILAVIVNVAANIAQRGIASVSDIEDAVKLGLGYPYGPLSWGDVMGGERILTILRNMQAATGDPRYRPSLWLTRRVGLGTSLLTAEASRSGSEAVAEAPLYPVNVL